MSETNTTETTQAQTSETTQTAQTASQSKPSEATQTPQVAQQSQPSETTTAAPSQEQPTQSQQASQSDSELQKQVDMLHKELQLWKLKSSLADRHLIPHDFELVARLVTESLSKFAGDVDKCVTHIYTSSQYLFKSQEQPKNHVDPEKEKSDNKTFIDGAIKRLNREPIKL